MKPKTAERGLGWAFCCALLLCVAACCPCAGESPWSDPDANATHPPRPRKDGAVVLSSPGGWLGQMTSDKTHLFWVRGHRDEARVMAVPKKGGATRTVLHPGHNVTRLRIFGDHAYVSTWSGLWRVALGDDFLYWGRGWARIGATGRSGNRGRRGGYKAGRKKGEGGVMRVSLKESAKEGSASTSVNLVDDVQKVRGVAVDGRFVYWMDHYEGIIAKTALDGD